MGKFIHNYKNFSKKRKVFYSLFPLSVKPCSIAGEPKILQFSTTKSLLWLDTSEISLI